MEAYKQTDNYKEFAKKFAAWKEQEAEEKASGKNKKKNGKKSPKKPKAPESMPKRSMSSYFLFSNQRRESMKAENPDKKLTQIAVLIAAEWKTKSEDEKKEFVDLALKLKAEYVAKMEEYKKCDDYAKYMTSLEEWKAEKKAWEKADEMDVDSDDDMPPLKVSFPKKPKDEKCPKRPLSNYFLYAKDVRASVKEEFPEMKITDIAKEISKKWKLLSDEEKKPFVDEATTLKEKYNKDIEEYKGSEAEKAFKVVLANWKTTCEQRTADAKEKRDKRMEREAKKNKKKKTPTKGKKKKVSKRAFEL